MAKSNRSTLDRSEYRYSWLIVGSKEQLITEQVVRPEWLEDGSRKDKRGRSIRSKEVIHDGRCIRTSQRNNNNRYLVSIEKTPEEVAAYDENERARESRGMRLDFRRGPDLDHVAVARVAAQLQAAALLSPVRRRLAGCRGLFDQAAADIEKKIGRIESAHTQYPYDPERREDAIELRDSSTLGRSIEDLERIRSSIAEIVVDLKRMAGES